VPIADIQKSGAVTVPQDAAGPAHTFFQPSGDPLAYECACMAAMSSSVATISGRMKGSIRQYITLLLL